MEQPNFDTMAKAKEMGFVTVAEAKGLLPEAEGYTVTDTSGVGCYGYDYSIQKGDLVIVDSHSVSTGMGNGWKNIKITPMFKLSEIVALVA